MRRLAVPVAVAILAIACSDEPMLATDLESATTSSTTTSTTSSTTTIMDLSTTTTVDTGPNVSDLLRIAHDELYEFDSLHYAASTDTDVAILGMSRSTTVGRWNRNGTSELQIAFDLDERSTRIVALSLEEDLDDVAATLQDLSILYRFPADGLAWFSPSTTPEWLGVPAESFGDGAVDVAADALTYLDPLFESVIEIDPEPTIDSSARSVYHLTLDADLVVPFMASGSTAQNIFDAGWDGISDATTTGSVTLDEGGSLVAASVDQTPWWRAGWDTVGASSLIGDDASILWTMVVRTSNEQSSVTAPCDEPTTEFDPELGVDVLTCV